MRKYIVVILCVLLVAVAAVPAFAAEETKVTVTASDKDLERGDTVVFTVSVSGDVAFTSFMVDLNFDNTYFEYVGSQINTEIGSATLLEYSPATPELGLAFIGGGSGTVNTWVQKLTFKVKNTAPLKKVTVIPVSPATNKITVKCEGVTVSIDCKHTYGEWSKVDDGKHQRICSKCQTPQIEEHDWNDGQAKPAADCDTPGKIEYKCLFCSATKTEDVKALGHKFDNDCDATCNRTGCDYTRTASHKYASAWSSDKNGHWHECSVCGDKKDSAKHTPGPAATEQNAQLCTVCNYELAPAIGHVHEMSEEWITDDQYHWHRCQKKNPSCYHVEDKAEHDYDNDCDVSCNTCAYIRIAPHSYTGEWKAGPDGHWYVCTACGVKSEVYQHEPGPEATQDTPQTCIECNFVIKLPLSHVHEFGEEWYSDEEHHWQSCTDSACLETTEKQPHTWDEGVELDDGTLQYTCTVCGVEKVTGEPIPGPTEPAPTVPSSPSANQDPEQNDSGSFPWQWAGIAALVLLVIGIVLLVIEFIRSRKVNSHGRFSK